ncbi:PAS domain S-box protein [Leptolyngbya sp. FACHB-16]|uniref:PAS domain S-box protein n=1 Tax=unclassified Leptolyngbya TaxID=2650499 RepID=UPI001686A32C|nr:PAS domain S-box protein [Leptolyngbya sp. FACHB-16]MBD2158120.1 PAS domain S-box protein [Leptolyngbya sp. FACHB-16]
MHSTMYRLFLRYGVAVASTAIALLLTLWLEPYMVRTVGAFFYGAVIVSTWYGGRRPGMVSILLSVLALDWYVITPHDPFLGADASNLVPLGIFMLIALTINLLGANLRASKRRVERLNRMLQQENAERLSNALNAAQMGLWDWDMINGTVEWSPEHEQLLGLAPGEFDGQYATFDACLHPDDRSGLTQAITHSLEHRIAYHHEFRVVWKDGSTHWIEGRGRAYYNFEGQPVRMSGTIMAIDARKKAELALQQLNADLEQRISERTTELSQVNDRLLETILEQQHTQLLLLEQAQLLDLAHDTILTCDLNWVITFWNEGAERMYGWTKKEALGKETTTLLKTQFPHPLDEIKTELFERGYWEGELVQWDKSDRPLFVASRWVVQKDLMGRPIKILEITNDITARKEAEQALQRYTREIEDLYNNAPCGYHSVDAEGTLVRMNDTELRWFGYTRDEILYQKKLVDLLAPESRAIFHDIFSTFKQQGWINNLELEVINRDGTTRWVNLNATAIYDADGNFVTSRSSLFDVSDRKQAEAEREQVAIALQESEATFRLLSEFAPMGIFLCDSEGSCTYTNPRYQAIVGCTAEEALGNSWINFVHPEDRPWIHDHWKQLVNDIQEGIVEDMRYQDRQGRVRHALVRTSPIRTTDGTVIHFVGVVEDITERHEIDQMKKDFISVVSHELRTPLTSIRGSLGLVAGGVYDQKPEKMKAMIDIAARQSDRLVRLVNDILDLRRLESGQTLFNLKLHNSEDLIQQSVDVMRSQAGQNDITLTIIPNTNTVWADADAILQTLTNLLSNAIKFSPPGSTVWLKAEPLEAGEKESDGLRELWREKVTERRGTERFLSLDEASSLGLLPPRPPAPSTSYILFSIQDQGRGIPADQLEKIFGQFQQVDASDSREKGGTGLGLAICRTIVEQHRGKIWVESELGKGSTFYFTLPTTSDVNQACSGD